jgi:putative transposase
MQLRSRKNIRLKGYDYRRSGAYYVTICTHDRSMLFGDVVDGIMVPNAIGNIVQQCWDAIPDHMPMVVCDAFVVMPNHVHGIIVITDVAADGAGTGGGAVGAANSPTLQNTGPADGVGTVGEFADPTTPRHPPVAIMVKNSLGHIMQTFKAAVSRQVYREGLLPRGRPIWQSRYYDRIIRDDGAYRRIADYIRNNPANWGKDRFNR